MREIYKDLNCTIFGDTNKKDEIKKYINNIKVNYSEIKDDEKYFHNDECPISFEKFNDDDLVILLKCRHYFKSNEVLEDLLSKMYANENIIFCPLCKNKEQNFNEEEDYFEGIDFTDIINNNNDNNNDNNN